jgi:DNA-binding MarR family transcriptional regulator
MSYAPAEDLDLCMRVRAMCACNQMRRATRGITQIYEAEMTASGVKVTQLPILVGLRSEGDLSVTRLAGALSLDRTTLTRNLSVLEKRGLIRMTEDLDDARVRMVSLTSDGEQVLSGALARWKRIQDAVEERFGKERLRLLYEELNALADVVAEAVAV